MTANTEVDKLVEQVNRAEELQQLYRSLGYRSFRDSTRQLATEHNPDAEEAKGTLDQIIHDISCYRAEGKVDTRSYKDSVFEKATSYLRSTSLHSHWLATFVLTAIFDAELTPLTRECNDMSAPWRVTSMLPQPWGTIIPTFLSSLFFLALSAIAILLYSLGWPWAALIVAGYLGWHYFHRYKTSRAFVAAKEKQARLCGALALVREEVASGNFDALEIASRLKRWEAEGLYVHSLTYAVLRSMTAR